MKPANHFFSSFKHSFLLSFIHSIISFFLFFFFTSFLFAVLISCNTTEPEPQPGRRDYLWSLDTLQSPFNYFTGLWGSSPSDVWTIGGGADDDNRLWHFDGVKWSTYNKEQILCTGSSLIGFAQNNVWMGGGEGRIWHYDGNRWKENYVYTPNDGYATIMDMWGKNSSDIYAVGLIYLPAIKEQRGLILHYDGYKWSEYYKADYISQFNSILGDNKNVFITGIKIIYYPDNSVKTDSVYISKIKNRRLESIYRPQVGKSFSLATVGGEIHFVLENALYKYYDNGMKHIMDINEPKFASCVYGRNYKDLFIKMYNGLGHFNGTDIVYLLKFNNDFSHYNGRLMDFGNAIFFNNSHTINIRGFLK